MSVVGVALLLFVFRIVSVRGGGDVSSIAAFFNQTSLQYQYSSSIQAQK